MIVWQVFCLAAAIAMDAILVFIGVTAFRLWRLEPQDWSMARFATFCFVMSIVIIVLVAMGGRAMLLETLAHR